jgi:hypothetical protein
MIQINTIFNAIDGHARKSMNKLLNMLLNIVEHTTHNYIIVADF